ncbi:hypothetical protein H1R20_g13932, partial [Candolleomyces eurysporus]
MASQPLMNSSNIAEFWKERLTEIRPKFFLTPSVPAQHTITQNSTLNQPLVEQAVHILTHNPTLLSKPEVVGQAILQDNHLNDIHSTASIHYAHNPFPKELRVALQRLIRSGIRDCGDQPLPHWAQTGRETKDVLRSGGRDTLRTVPTKRSFSAMGQLPNTPFRLPASSSSASEFRPYGSMARSKPFLSYAARASCNSHPSVTGTNATRTFPIPPASLPADPTPTPTPSPAKKVPKETKETPKETPKEPKEKKPKLAKAEAPSSKVTTEGSAKVKAKETATKTKAKAAREPSEVKTRAKTQAASTAEASKGKGKQRAAVKPKTVVEKKETVEEPVKEKEKEEEPEKETVPETVEEEGEVLSWGDEDIEMEETGAAGEVEAAEEEADLMEEEEESE